MKALVDTHVLMWWALDHPKLSWQARAFIAEPDNQLFFSAASCWELVLWHQRKKLRLPEECESFLQRSFEQHGVEVLPVHFSHVMQTFRLPQHHADPFDRLLVAQCQVENMPLLSDNTQMDSYDVELIW